MRVITLWVAGMLACSNLCLAASADQALADYIDTVASRETQGLVSERLADGTVKLDLQGRFRNVVLARLEGDQPRAHCVASVPEASQFFGRDLRTGASLPSSKLTPARSELKARADLHGMTPLEYQFYWNLIEQEQAMTAKRAKSAAFNVINADGAGEGFNDPTSVVAEGGNPGTTRGQQRLNVFARAGEIWGAFLDSNVTISVEGNFNPLACTSSGAVLGSAGSNGLFRDFSNRPFTNTFYAAALANKLRGLDLDPATADIGATFNSLLDSGCLSPGLRFYYGFDNSTPAARINLLVVVLHEIGHGLGSASFASATTGAFAGGSPDAWSRLMFDTTQSRTWFEMSNAQRAASAINTSNLYWSGDNVAIASSFLTAGRDPANGRVQLFAPNPVQSGSSVSHFTNAASPNLLMEPFINTGIPLTLDLTRQQMRDIGWYRDTTSDLVADTLSNVLPSGTTVAPGSVVAITWTNGGGFNRSVTIDLSTDGGVTFPTVVASDTANTGTFSWTVPNTPTTQARLRVREHDFVAPSAVSAANFSIAFNTAPSFSPAAAITRERGTPPGAAVAIGTASDAQSAAGTLSVTSVAGGTSTGIVVGTISNSAGTISAPLSASCTATSGSVRFQVSDGMLSSTGELSVNVAANPPPTLAYAAQNVNGASALIVNPLQAPADNGTVASVAVHAVGTYTGTVSVNASGVVSFSNASPIGTHVIIVRATDNCGATTDAPFNLTVNNTAPSISAGSAQSRQQGSAAGAEVVLANVSDAQSSAASLTVSAIGGGTASGITVAGINNLAGTIRGTLQAACNALGGTVNLQVSDGNLTASAALTVNVSANTAPTLGTYPSTLLALGASAQISPSAVPNDSGSISSTAVAAAPLSFTGTLSVAPLTGVVSVSNAGPLNSYTITVTATDNCSAATQRSFSLSAGDLIFRDAFGN